MLGLKGVPGKICSAPYLIVQMQSDKELAFPGSLPLTSQIMWW